MIEQQILSSDSKEPINDVVYYR